MASIPEIVEIEEMVAFLDIAEIAGEIQTRNLDGPVKMPDFSSYNSLESIKEMIKILNVRCIIYKSKDFKQIPQKNHYLRTDDTLKIYLSPSMFK